MHPHLQTDFRLLSESSAFYRSLRGTDLENASIDSICSEEKAEKSKANARETKKGGAPAAGGCRGFAPG